MLRLLASAAIASSLIATPVLAAPTANPAASLSLSQAPSVRASTGSAKHEKLAGAGFGIVLAIAVGAAAVAGAIIASDDDKSDSP
jgi:hypothetical protein